MQTEPHNRSAEQKFGSAKTLARRYDVHLQTIWRWARDGDIPQPSIKANGATTRWDIAEVDAALQQIRCA